MAIFMGACPGPFQTSTWARIGFPASFGFSKTWVCSIFEASMDHVWRDPPWMVFDYDGRGWGAVHGHPFRV